MTAASQSQSVSTPGTQPAMTHGQEIPSASTSPQALTSSLPIPQTPLTPSQCQHKTSGSLSIHKHSPGTPHAPSTPHAPGNSTSCQSTDPIPVAHASRAIKASVDFSQRLPIGCMGDKHL